MDSKTWKTFSLNDISIINPRESLKKGERAKSVAMEKLTPFCRKIDGFEVKEFGSGTKFKNGDTLLARITPCLENGKTAYVDILGKDEIGFGSTEYIVIREKSGISDSKFLYYFSTSPRFREAAIKSMTGTSGRQRVQTDLIISKEFTFPELPEQKAIAAVLTSFDDKIELLSQQNQTLEEMAQTLFKEWFLDFRFPGSGKMVDSELGMIPEGWKVDGLSSIAEFLNGIALQKYPPENEWDSLPVIKIKELNNGISEQTDKASKKIPKKYLVENGDILFSWSGSLELVIWKYGTGALNQHLFKVSSEIFPKWFYYQWIKHHLQNFRQIASSKATTMGHIQRYHLDEARVIIPDPKSFQIASNIFSPLIDKIINNNNQIQSLTKLRDSLLPKLMSGEIRVKM